MVKLKRTYFILLFVFASSGYSQQPNNDISIAFLGNPFKNINIPWARNVWDMIVFENHIYLAYGDYHRNIGPVHIFFLDPLTDKFIKEFTIQEEAIEKYQIFDGELYIHGVDATEGWDFGNFYRKDKNGWKKFRTVPNANHVHEIYKYNNRLFVAIGTPSDSLPKNLIFQDQGLTWEPIPIKPLPNIPIKIPEMVIQGYFILNGNLYGATGGKLGQYNNLYFFNGLNFEIICIEAFPGSLAEEIPDWHSIVSYQNKIIYIGQNGVEHTSNEGTVLDFEPKGLYYLEDLNTCNQLLLPAEFLPFDLNVYNSVLYILLAQRHSEINYTIKIVSANDLIKLHDEIEFEYDTFARSFEIYDDTFYLGMGGFEAEKNCYSAGDIIKVSHN
jgi:hypothetical protein